MDVRFLAFLAGRPSAVIQPREHFCGLPKRALAFLLANVMFWQPLWAQADGIAVSGSGTSLGQAGNGVPIVNIAAPNGSGLSHNQFSDYNVGREGLILNNATGRTQSTQLGGIILGNSNLQGTAASTILNEVTGSNPSHLRGFTEVAGQSARVIVANPHGITCNGCGFINTPRVTLSTGKPILDGNGQVRSYQVDGGAIAIEGTGLDARNVDRFELITRSAKVNAKLHAKQLDIVTGRNDVDANTLKATARASDGSAAPSLAIDSTALGGMYAGAIRLVGTEQGVGVRLAGDMAVDAGDLDIDASGKLTLANASAGRDVKLKADEVELTGSTYAGRNASVHSSGDVEVRQSLAARQHVTVDGAQVRNHGVIEAGVEADKRRNDSADLTLTSTGLVNSGQIVASRDLTVTVDDTLVNSGGLKGQRQTVVADTLDKAGGNLNVVASSATAGKTLDASADGDINVIAGEDMHSVESRYKKGGKKVHEVDEHSRQVAASLSAGGDLEVKGGNDVNLIASQLKAGEEAYVYAGNDLNLIAGQERDYTLYDMEKKGGWGSTQTRRDEVTQITHIGTEITSGGDLTLVSGGNQLYQRAKLDSGKDINLISDGAITFAGVKDLHQESHTKSKGDLAWTSMKGKGSTDETLQQSYLLAKGDVVIQAVDGVKVDIRHIDQKSVSQTIDAMVAADPQLAWLKDAEKNGDVDWRRVQEVHDSFKYSHSGLGVGAQMVIAILIAYFTAGAASGLVASGASAAGASTAATTAGGMWAAGTGATLQGIGWANAMVTAGAMGLTSNAAISTINNKGNLSLVLKDVTSEDALRGYAVAGITAGLTTGLFDGWMKTETTAVGNATQTTLVVPSGGLSTWGGIGQFAGNQLLHNGTSTVLDRALGGDSSFSDALRSSLANTFAAAGFNLIGDISLPDKLDLKDGGLAKIALHALMGGLAAEAAGGDFKAGALAAGLNEALVDTLSSTYDKMEPGAKKDLLVMNAQLIGILAAAAGGGDGDDLQTGAWTAVNSTQYNYLLHEEVQQMLAEQQACGSDQCKSEIAERYHELDIERNKRLDAACEANPVGCDALLKRLVAERPENQALVDGLRREGKGKDAFVVSYLIGQSNEQAMHSIAAALGPDSPLEVAFGETMLKWATGSAGLQKPGSMVGIKGNGTGSIAKEPVYKTTKEATAAAAALGYRKINETVHGGQAVYRKGSFYITRDLDGHNGGAWKGAASVKDLGSRSTRTGTFDVKLKRIGD